MLRLSNYSLINFNCLGHRKSTSQQHPTPGSLWKFRQMQGTKLIPLNATAWLGTDVSDSKLVIRPEWLSECFQITCVSSGSYWAWRIKANFRHSPPFRLVLGNQSRGELAKPQFQTNYRQCMKHTTICSLASVEERRTGHPVFLVSPEGSITWAINNSSPVGCVTLR